MKHRSEIDGLRAIAVLPVIFFHAGFEWFKGGYIGVDIFFVISGYLITTIILEECQAKKFSIVNFYERRARRILPALTFMLVVTSITAYLVMPPVLLESYSRSLASVSVFISNIHFYLSSGYFAAASEEKPLLHTWSLAVEEQYYVFFPLFIMFCWGLGKKLLFISIILGCVLSLSFAQLLSNHSMTNMNFYLIFSRAWELLFGSAIAFGLAEKITTDKVTKNAFSLLGFVALLVSIFTYDKYTPFPSVYALLPVVGTCLVIMFADKDNFVGKLLSLRFMVWVGLISYSLYLWHQPFLAFLRLKTIGEPSELAFIIAILLTFLMAYVSYKYVETPFRSKSRYNRKQIFQYSAASIVGFLLIGYVGILQNGFDHRFGEKLVQMGQYSPKRSECHTQGNDYLSPSKACRYFSEDISWAALGDSHMVEPAYALAEELDKHNKGLLHLSFSSCLPALNYSVTVKGCKAWLEESLSMLEQDESITNVVVGFRHAAYLYGDQLADYPDLPDVSPVRLFVGEASKLGPDKARELYWQDFNLLVQRLENAGKNVYLLYPIPELPADIKKAASPLWVFNTDTLLPLDAVSPVDYYFARQQEIVDRLDRLQNGKVVKLEPFNVLCKEKFCKAIEDDKTLYFDDDHLSLTGARLVVEQLDL